MFEILCATIGLTIGMIFMAIVLPGIRVLKEYERAVIYRFGRLVGIKGPGLCLILPGLNSMKVVDLRVVTQDISPQESMTKDNVTVRVNAVLYYKVTDPIKAVNEVKYYDLATSRGAQTTLRNVIGQNNLDDLLKNRDVINTRLRQIIDEMTDPWGIKVEQVEIKDLEVPTSMQRAMAKEAEAEREKRARLIKAQGELEATKTLKLAADEIVKNPATLELRRMQMITEVGMDQNTSTIFFIPSEFMAFAKTAGEFAKSLVPGKNDKKKTNSKKKSNLFSDDAMVDIG
jgi:regulator of protease activity HflC (stomatin/prohibitin superfamily)